MTVKKVRNRLRSRSGETLVEATASILIFTLSSLLLLSMLGAAARINAAAKEADQNWADQLNAAEIGDAATAKDGTVYLYIGDDFRDYDVTFSQLDGDASALYAYYPVPDFENP